MMDEFLQLLIKYFNSYNLVPPEVQSTDIGADREKSYLYDLPETPDNVVVFKNYSTKHASLQVKNVGVKRIQIIVRNKSQKQAFEIIQGLYYFLLQRPESIEELNSKTWAIFDCKRGPTKITIDEKHRHIWSLSFPVTTNLF